MEFKNTKKLKVLILYWSATGNTEKVAFAIQRGLEKEKVKPTLKKFAEAVEEDLCSYDLIFIGAPPYQFLPPQPVQRYLSKKQKFHHKRGDVKLGAPKIPGKAVAVFCTYAGPHTGVNEAIPAVKYMGQFFEHIGFDIVGEWYIIGEYHSCKECSISGRLGDIRDRPNEKDLRGVENRTSELVRNILATWR